MMHIHENVIAIFIYNSNCLIKSFKLNFIITSGSDTPRFHCLYFYSCYIYPHFLNVDHYVGYFTPCMSTLSQQVILCLFVLNCILIVNDVTVFRFKMLVKTYHPLPPPGLPLMFTSMLKNIYTLCKR